MRLPSFLLTGPILLAVAVSACGGVVDDARNNSHGNAIGGTAASGGGMDAASEAAAGGGHDPDAGAGGGELSDAKPLPVEGGDCTQAWWGGTLDGVTGALECRDPWDPAMLAYGQTQIPADWKMSGPVSSGKDGEHLSCCYQYQEGNAAPFVSCMTVPYFGDGSTTTVIPEGSVLSEFGLCSNHGPAATVLTESERASRLIGVWLRCSASEPPWEGNAVVLRADGTYHTLQTDTSGKLLPTTGCYQGGLWGLIPNPTAQVNFYSQDTTMMVTVDFHDSPERIQLQMGSHGPTEFVKIH